jgi:hypothetical protein
MFHAVTTAAVNTRVHCKLQKAVLHRTSCIFTTQATLVHVCCADCLSCRRLPEADWPMAAVHTIAAAVASIPLSLTTRYHTLLFTTSTTQLASQTIKAAAVTPAADCATAQSVDMPIWHA